jgi:outer membrane protein assembly factor BamB
MHVDRVRFPRPGRTALGASHSGWIGVVCLILVGVGSLGAVAAEKRPDPVRMVVLDPLAKELACACVQGHGQRDYRKLAARLEKAVQKRLAIEFSDDLVETLSGVGPDSEIIVVGDRALVTGADVRTPVNFRPVCELTDREGRSSARGLFVVRRDDPARSLADLGGRTIFLAPKKEDARYAAARATLSAANLRPSVSWEDRPEGNEAALDVMDSEASPLPVALIPDYALPLLEGCGTLRKGELRVVGQTGESPFITVFLSSGLVGESAQRIVRSLVDLRSDSKLLRLMESRDGFRQLGAESGTGAPPVEAVRGAGAVDSGWPDWRGPRRDGRVARLPARLPNTAKFVWKKGTMPGGLAGLSVLNGRVLVAERDFADTRDVYRCLHADTGELLWRREFPASGKLDFGQSPRASPVLHGDRAYLLGAFGGLRCVKMADGSVLWERHLPSNFRGALPTWGLTATPLVVDDLLIVSPGAEKASVVALELATGATRWASPGPPAAYAAFICGEFGGRRQIIGYDRVSLGGWDVKTGERLWRLVPEKEGDFNVPTPVAVADGVVVTSENNGTRFYRFDAAGRIVPKPAGEYADLAPDTSSPVVSGGRLIGVHHGVHCLDLGQGLRRVWRWDDEALGDYAAVLADDERVLIVTLGGELVLLRTTAGSAEVLSRLPVFADDVEVYSHPALVGERLYLRGGSQVVCLDLGGA